MAIRLWEPKWYKYWCEGRRTHYDTRYKYEDDGLNHIHKTHRGYIIPNDASLEVEPSTAWYITWVISVVVRLSMFGLIAYELFVINPIYALALGVFIWIFRFVPVGCNGNSLYDIIFWNWK